MIAVYDPVRDVNASYAVGLEVLDLLRNEESFSEAVAYYHDGLFLCNLEWNYRLRALVSCDPAEDNGRVSAVDASGRSLRTVDHYLSAAAAADVDIAVHEFIRIHAVDVVHRFGFLVQKFFFFRNIEFFGLKRASAMTAYQKLLSRVKDQLPCTVPALCDHNLSPYYPFRTVYGPNKIISFGRNCNIYFRLTV